ncbi:zeatin O-xylosyltransferase-like [Humulus lupulus]|uniref:zeatin O-xylosyltransferase-like n=1 Tax=Humulus lupulus TaxID=3486 RepID=UPI002B414D1F|nr:zeatin O-xylosyltransferase-like [Humulus lupulus]
MTTPSDENKSFEPQSLRPVVVAVVPFPAQSHLNQLLQLSHVLSSHDIPVHYIGSTLHNSQVKSRASIPLNHLTKIHFHDFQTPQFPSPNSVSKTKFPQHGLSTLKAITSLRHPIFSLLRSLSHTATRLVVVYDTFMASLVQDVISLPNAEAYCFNSASAFSCFAFVCQFLGHKDKVLIRNLPSGASCFPTLFRIFMTLQGVMSDITKSGSLFNTYRAIEGSFLDEIESNKEIFGRRKMWALGPLLHQTTTITNELKEEDEFLFHWLDKQEQNSVLYISFGTTTTLSDVEIRELALGLEQSGVKFVWAFRDADKADVFCKEEWKRHDQLPNGFEERIRSLGVGMVLRNWVPQVKILGHSSTGGFMSHCGWNSCMESLTMGVPMAAWPMHSDQPMNAVLITEVLKAGVAVMEWKQRDELVTSSMIAMAARKLMASKEGEEIRVRVEELSKAVERSLNEGGDNCLEWDSFVAHISRESTSARNSKKYYNIRLKLIRTLVNFSMPLVFGMNFFIGLVFVLCNYIVVLE